MGRFELVDEQRAAVKKKIKYAIRRFASDEMKHVSLHARIMQEIYTEGDPNFRLMEFIDKGLDNSIDMDYDDYTDTTFNNNDQGPQLTDLEDFLPNKLMEMRYFPHLFDEQVKPTSDKELVFWEPEFGAQTILHPKQSIILNLLIKFFIVLEI